MTTKVRTRSCESCGKPTESEVRKLCRECFTKRAQRSEDNWNRYMAKTARRGTT